MAKAKNKSRTISEKQRRINLYKNVIIVILIIIIILLLLHDCDGKNKGKDLKDNYDIYELDCECEDKTVDDGSDKDIKDPDKPSNPDKPNNPNKPNKPNRPNNGSNNSNNNGGNNNNSNSNSNSNNEQSNNEQSNGKQSDSGNNNQNNNQNNNDNTPSGNIPDENPDETEDAELEVFDNDLEWSSTSQVHVFRNPVYEMDEIIAPGSTNSYKFYIRNNKECNIKYKLKFIEENPYGINMKYKLKKDGNYVISNWVSANELVISDELLNSQEDDEYILEWMWQHNDTVDADIGKNIDAYYKLNITISGEQVD